MRQLAQKTRSKFEMDRDETLPIEFTGIFLRKGDGDITFTVEQNSYVEKNCYQNCIPDQRIKNYFQLG